MKDDLRATRQEHTVQFLDQLRGLAILAVFLCHSYVAAFRVGERDYTLSWSELLHASVSLWILFPVSIGWVGVPMFFVISGFCINLSKARSRDQRWGTFFTRRFFRIYPPYLLVLLFFSFLFPLTSLGQKGWLNPELWAHLLLIHNFWEFSRYGIDAALWSIAIEVQLYLIYPLLIVLVRRLRWRATLGVVLGVELLMREAPSILHHVGPQYSTFATLLIWTPFNFWFSWTLGAKLADDWLEKRPLLFSRFSCWPFIAAFLICAICPAIARFAFLFGALATTVIIAKALTRADSGAPPHALLANRTLGALGIISYSVYLLHQPLIPIGPLLLNRLGVTPQGWLAFGVSVFELLPICALSWLCWKFVELPSSELGKWLIGGKTNPAKP